jgi:hypothetical protein
MEYVFDVMSAEGNRVETTTNYKELNSEIFDSGGYVVVNYGNEFAQYLFRSKDDLEDFIAGIERSRQWSTKASPWTLKDEMVFSKNADVKLPEAPIKASKLGERHSSLLSDRPSGIHPSFTKTFKVKVYDPMIVAGIKDIGNIEVRESDCKSELSFDYATKNAFITTLKEKTPTEKHPTWQPFEELEKLSQHDTESSLAKKIDPSYYQNYMPGLQWLEAMQHTPRCRNPEHFKAVLEVLLRKYLDRCGGKDEELQEVMKGLWYHKFLAAYIKNGNKPIFIKDIDDILKA